MAANYVGIEDYQKAVCVFSAIEKHKPLDYKQLSLYGISHLALGNNEKADKIFEKIQKDYTNNNTSLAFQIFKARGEYKSAIDILVTLYCDLEDAMATSMKQNFGQTLSEIHQEDQKAKEDKISSERAKQLAILGISILLIAIITTIFVRWHHNNGKMLQKNIIIAQNLQEVLQIKETGLTEATKSIKRLIAARFETIDNLSKTIFEYKATGLVKKKISAEIETLIEQMSSYSQKIEELELIVNENCENVLFSLKKELPNLKRADYMLYMYTVLGFSINAIALFLKEDKLEAIYNRKARLKNKIRTLSPERASFYLEYL